MAVSSKADDRRDKPTEMWDSRTLATHIWDVFELVVSTASWGYSVHLSQTGISPEVPAAEQNGLKLGLEGTNRIYMGIFELIVFKTILGHLVQVSQNGH